MSHYVGRALTTSVKPVETSGGVRLLRGLVVGALDASVPFVLGAGLLVAGAALLL